jgi:hypothetical protein
MARESRLQATDIPAPSVILHKGKLGGSLLSFRGPGPVPRRNVKNRYECYDPA